ncbi:TPA: hypothetical protein ACKPZ3_003087 [Serratia marcescens]
MRFINDKNDIKLYFRRLISKFSLRFHDLMIWQVVIIFSVILLIINTLNLSFFKVDVISVFLLLVILSSPYIKEIKRIKYGDFELEKIDSKEIDKLVFKVEESLPQERMQNERVYKLEKDVEIINELKGRDPMLALAKLRMEIERRISIYVKYLDESEGSRIPPLRQSINSLISKGVIAESLGESLLDVISISNRAIHGADIDEEDKNRVINLGVKLLEELSYDIEDNYANGEIISECVISNEECEKELDSGKYLLTTIIPLVDEPKKIVRKVTQEQLNNYFEYYNEFAEFIVELKSID